MESDKSLFQHIEKIYKASYREGFFESKEIFTQKYFDEAFLEILIKVLKDKNDL